MPELEEQVPNEYYTLPIGKARSVREGNDITIITYGAAVHWAKHIVEKLGVDAEIVDLRTLMPWDQEAVEAAVKKTGKAIVFHEDTFTGGIGAEIAAHISQICFEHLDAPVIRVGSLDTPVPLAKHLEDQFLPQQRFEDALKKLMEY